MLPLIAHLEWCQVSVSTAGLKYNADHACIVDQMCYLLLLSTIYIRKQITTLLDDCAK